ncbi:hypothetical protein ACFX15_022545 [Malus domestica]
MAFWGVEVKPGNPFTHIFDGLKGRLHVSMATLGNGTATKKSTLQCNVGNKSPVYLCSLFPEKAESLQINVEFEECEEVIFSVLGPRSVHLSGHYLPRHQHHNFDDDNSESYGEDIANSETKMSVDSEEDKYEDSFINDDDPEVFPASPVLDSEEELLDEHKPHNGKGHRRRLRKMYQVSESEVEGEDDDRCLISSLYKTKSSTRNTTEEVEEKVDKRAADTTTSNETEDGVFNATETMNDGDDVDVDGQLKRRFDQPVDTFLPSSEEGLEIGGTPKKKRKERLDDKAFESGFREKEDEAQNDDTKVENRTQNLCVEDGQEQKVANHIALEGPDDFSKPSTEVNLENDGKLKKKRKERPEDKALKAGILEKEDEKPQKDDTRAKNRIQNLCVEDGQEQIVANHIAPEGPDDFPKPSTEVNLENGGKLKKKWKERPKDKALEKVDEAQKDDTRAQIQTQILCVMDGQEQKVAKHISVPEGPDDLSKPSIEVNLENGEGPKKKRKKRVEGKILEVVCTNLDDVVKEDKGQQDEARGGICPDLPVRSEQNQQSAKDGNSGHDSGRFVDGQSDEKKVKKKKKKSKTEAHEVAGNTDVPLLSAEDNANAKSSQVKTFPSGLRIEELEAGKPDGKVATSGKKISVHYVGKLKENGKVMDSTDSSSAPYRFRLGKGEVIDGWDVGIDGMRVGEKRRLVIPPSLAYGSRGDGAGIPPNSWLEYDIELVKAR